MYFTIFVYKGMLTGLAFKSIPKLSLFNGYRWPFWISDLRAHSWLNWVELGRMLL